jgi:cell division protein FtsW (lipid II flippase)
MIAKIEQLKVFCEEQQRQLFYHMFLMAGLSLLSAQCAESNQNYKHDGYDSYFYLRRALQIYMFVFHSIKKHRQTCRLLSLVRMDGDRYNILTITYY